MFSYVTFIKLCAFKIWHLLYNVVVRRSSGTENHGFYFLIKDRCRPKIELLKNKLLPKIDDFALSLARVLITDLLVGG